MKLTPVTCKTKGGTDSFIYGNFVNNEQNTDRGFTES